MNLFNYLVFGLLIEVSIFMFYNSNETMILDLGFDLLIIALVIIVLGERT